MIGTNSPVQYPPSQQRGGTTPGEVEVREKGPWAEVAAEGIVPSELGGSDAPREILAEDPQLGSPVLGETTGSDEPATAGGIDPSAGDEADAMIDAGPELPEGVEPDLKDAAAARRQADIESAESKSAPTRNRRRDPVQTPAPFEYERATSVDGAIASLQKLGPRSACHRRRAQPAADDEVAPRNPEHLIDINDLEELSAIREEAARSASGR